MAWGFIGLGVLALGFGVYMLLIARESASWPTVEGQIEAVKIEKTTRRASSSSSRSSTARPKKTRYHVALVYSYAVDGQRYEASRYSIGQGSRISKKYKQRDEARQAARAYATGDAIVVHYNPDDPSEAVIQAGVTGASWVPFVFGLLFAGVGSYLLLIPRRRKVPEPENSTGP